MCRSSNFCYALLKARYNWGCKPSCKLEQMSDEETCLIVHVYELTRWMQSVWYTLFNSQLPKEAKSCTNDSSKRSARQSKVVQQKRLQSKRLDGHCKSGVIMEINTFRNIIRPASLIFCPGLNPLDTVKWYPITTGTVDLAIYTKVTSADTSGCPI